MTYTTASADACCQAVLSHAAMQAALAVIIPNSALCSTYCAKAYVGSFVVCCIAFCTVLVISLPSWARLGEGRGEVCNPTSPTPLPSGLTKTHILLCITLLACAFRSSRPWSDCEWSTLFELVLAFSLAHVKMHQHTSISITSFVTIHLAFIGKQQQRASTCNTSGMTCPTCQLGSPSSPPVYDRNAGSHSIHRPR